MNASYYGKNISIQPMHKIERSWIQKHCPGASDISHRWGIIWDVVFAKPEDAQASWWQLLDALGASGWEPADRLLNTQMGVDILLLKRSLG